MIGKRGLGCSVGVLEWWGRFQAPGSRLQVPDSRLQAQAQAQAHAAL